LPAVQLVCCLSSFTGSYAVASALLFRGKSSALAPSLFSPLVSCCVVVLLAQVLEYLKKHHEFDKTSASQEDRSVA
jgi:hypothetical protein